MIEPKQNACRTCSHTWYSVPRRGVLKTPKRCPKCGNGYWNKPYTRTDKVRELETKGDQSNVQHP